MYKYYPKADLERHNRTINRLDKYEEIRYPNLGLDRRDDGMVG
jgi:hypothetical protein